MYYILQSDDNCDNENNSCNTDGGENDNRNATDSDYEDNNDNDEHKKSEGRYITYYIEYTI